MVLCVVIGCSKRSERDKDVSFYRLPAVHDREGKEDFELQKKRRDRYLAAISRQDIDVDELYKYRIYSLHFVSQKPADLYDYILIRVGYRLSMLVTRNQIVAYLIQASV